MARVRLFHSFPSDAGTVSASSEAYGLGAARLQQCQLAKKARTGTVLQDEWWKVDLGAAVPVSAFALLGHDLTAADSALVLEGNDADAWGAPAFSQALTYYAGSLVDFFASQTLRFWRFRFRKQLAAVARQAGRILLGTHYECTVNPTMPGGIEWGMLDPSEVSTTPGGQASSDRLEILRTLSLDFEDVPEAQALEFQRLFASRGQSSPYLVSVNHDVSPIDGLLYGMSRRQFARKIRAWDVSSRWVLTHEMVEAK